MAIKPILHRILVKPDVLEDVDPVFARAKAAGLEFDFNERKREQDAIDTGTVIEIGETAFKAFMNESPGSSFPVEVGDRVVYAKYGGKAATEPGTKAKYVLLNDEDIIAILK